MMKRVMTLITTVLALGVGHFSARCDEPIRFQEVFDLVREHLADVDRAELEAAAVAGFLEKLEPRVTLVGGGATVENEAAPAEPVAWTTTYESAFGYVRVQQVDAALAAALRQAVAGLSSSNKLKGVVLDLRYAGGGDYAAAGVVADLFFRDERPMVDYGEGVKRSTAKEDPIQLPLAVLVNRETAGAAEVLAGILREAGLGLLLGEGTAGQANLFREFPLETGQTLRVATGAVRVGDGVELSRGGVRPDIAVEVSEADGEAYYRDAYAVLEGDRTPSRRRRINEAELVRMAREGIAVPADELMAAEEAPLPRMLRDPALGRAIDLLKGIAVVKRYRSF